MGTGSIQVPIRVSPAGKKLLTTIGLATSEPESSKRAVKVFISYSHDSLEHRAKLWNFAKRLRSDGIDAVIDQYVPAPEEGFPRWMARQIDDADFVLLVTTETYLRRVEGREEPGLGH